MSAFTRAAILAIVASANAGCLITRDMWSQANSDVIQMPHIVGTIQPAGAARAEKLVIEYDVKGGGIIKDRPFYTLIPLDPTGRPATPLRYGGPSRDTGKIVEGLTPQQRQRVLDYRLSLDALQEGKRARRSSSFVPLNRPGGVGTHEGWRSGYRGVSVVGFWPAGRPRWTSLKLPADAEILILPTTQLRPSADRSDQVVLAVVATPLAVLADIVMTPIVLVAWNTGIGI